LEQRDRAITVVLAIQTTTLAAVAVALLLLVLVEQALQVLAALVC
jgi:hypothetical protein